MLYETFGQGNTEFFEKPALARIIHGPFMVTVFMRSWQFGPPIEQAGGMGDIGPVGKAGDVKPIASVRNRVPAFSVRLKKAAFRGVGVWPALCHRRAARGHDFLAWFNSGRFRVTPLAA